MKRYLVFVYIIGLLVVTTLIAQAGGMWEQVAYRGGGADRSLGSTGVIQASR